MRHFLLLSALATNVLLCPSGAAPRSVHASVQVRNTRFGVPESCLASKDLVVQALERLRADSSATDIGDANQLLKRASDLCSESGDAWYFRSLAEAKLNHKTQADYALRQAKMFPSDALLSGVNPFVLSTPEGKQRAPDHPIRHKWALVVGVGTFLGDVRALPYTVNDATAFRDMLLDPRYGNFPADNVKLVTNKDATLRTLKEDLNWLARVAEPDDLVVVYIASHGSARDADTREANYILTSDTEADTQDHLYATALPMVDLSYAVATRLRSLRTVIFVDTCFSEAATARDRAPEPGNPPGGGVSQNTLAQITQGTGRIIFAASKRDQESLESPELQHGYFTYYLVETLRAHPAMPLSQVFGLLQKQVSARVEKDYALYNLHQEPVMDRSSEGADFALGNTTTSQMLRGIGSEVGQ